MHCRDSLLPSGCRSVCNRFVFVLAVMAVNGCAVAEYQRDLSDADKDGVANINDKCPESEAAVVVNSQGCSLFTGALQGVDFETNELILSETAYPVLDELVDGLLANPQTVIGVHAHTDNRGRARLNLELSKLRVMKVVEYLVEKGVEGRQLKPFGFGESRPVVSNATVDGRLRNRRIEVVLLNGQIEQPLEDVTVGNL